MQVFVKRADLTAGTDPMPVIGTYLADDPAIPYTAHGTAADTTVLYLPTTTVIKKDVPISDPITGVPAADNPITIPKTVLVSNWRSNVNQIVNSEANRRIADVFPDYKQRNSTSTYQQCQTAFGADPSVWPPEAKAFKDEYDRGWSYVNAVRERTTALITSMPPDPTADSYWPTRIDPVSFEPVF
jgi:hypothetical protein